MDVDWIIAMGLFLVFISWSFVYYTGFFSPSADMKAGVEGISSRVVDYLSVDVYDVPVVYDSGVNGSRVLYMDFSWPPYSKNSTRIFSGNGTLPCRITGDRVYWQAGLSQGENRFVMRYHAGNGSLLCGSGFPATNASQAIPRAAERGRMFSQERISRMLAVDFQGFSYILGVSQDFRVELEIGNATVEYGIEPPLGYNVYVRETKGRTVDGDDLVVRVLTW